MNYTFNSNFFDIKSLPNIFKKVEIKPYDGELAMEFRAKYRGTTKKFRLFEGDSVMIKNNEIVSAQEHFEEVSA